MKIPSRRVTDGWTPIKRSFAARRTNAVLTIGLPFLLAGGAVYVDRFDDPLPAAAIGAALGVVIAPFWWWYRAASTIELRGSVLRIRGRNAATIDLAEVRVAHLERVQVPDHGVQESLQLKLFDADLNEVSIKLGDSKVCGELSMEGLTAIADQLDEHARTDARHDLADWLRDYAYRPRVDVWPSPA